jgi:hypothetical protein
MKRLLTAIGLGLASAAVFGVLTIAAVIKDQDPPPERIGYAVGAVLFYVLLIGGLWLLVWYGLVDIGGW